MRPTGRAVVAVCVCLAACRPSRVREPAAAAARAPDGLDAAVPDAAAPPERAPRWTLSAREAQQHGLAPLGFTLDDAPRSLIATRFPAPGTLALFSGPPGGPLGAIVEVDTKSGSDALTLRDVLRTSTAVRIGAPREFGEPEQVRFGGVLRNALAMTAGAGPSRTHYCLVMVPPPEGVPEGFLVWLYTAGQGVTAPSCVAVLEGPVLRAFAEGFRLASE